MILNGILKGDYQGLLDVIASEIPRPTFARLKPPLPQDLPPPPLLPSCGGGKEQIGRQDSLCEAGVRLPDAEVAASRTAPWGVATRQDSYDKN